MTSFTEDVQTRMRRDHIISKVFAAILLTDHKGGVLDLAAPAVKERMQLIADSSSIDLQIVLDAFYQVSKLASALPVRAVAAEVTGTRHPFKLTEKLGSSVKSDLSVFQELCIELLLEHEPGQFNLTGPDYKVRIARIREELAEHNFTSVQIAQSLHEINSLAFNRHQEKLEKELLEEEAEAAQIAENSPESMLLDRPQLRIASSQ